MQVLEGIRVLDVTSGPAGAQATTVLGDFGAQVLRIERPGGDPLRKHPASPFWFRGKQALTHDLATPLRAEHVASADVVVVDGTPAKLRARGLDAATLSADNPRLVHCTISGFGPTGPDAELPGFEGIVAARSGRMAAFDVQLDQNRPVFAAVQVGTHLASQGAVQGIIAALLQRERTGHADTVETSLLQAFTNFDLVDMLTRQLETRDGTPCTPLRLAHPMPTLNYHPVLTSDDSWIQCGNLLEHLFLSFLDTIDLLGELLTDERFHATPATWEPEAVEHARDRILTRIREHTVDEWMRRFEANGNVAAEPILTTEQALAHRDIVGSLVSIDDPVHGTTTQIGPIADLSATPAAPRPAETAPPRHEQANRASDREAAHVAPAAPAGHTPGQPLAGITILDLSTIIAAPLAMSMLADLGARVIKVEPLSGDPFRQLLAEGLMAVKTNMGKESICIDLKSERGQSLIHRMVARADVLIHNFRGRVPAKLGIDSDTLHAINPGLVWAVVSGYSATSPSAGRPATHPVIGASTGGVAWQAGDALTHDCPTLADIRETARQIMAANEANPDPNTSAVAGSAVLLALLARERHENVNGQVVRIDMQTANAWANGDDFLDYEAKPTRPAVDAGHLGLHATYRLYPCSSGWVFLAAATDNWFERLCLAAGWDLALDPRFATEQQRRAHDTELAAAITERLAERTASEWNSLFVAASVGCVRADGIDVGGFWANDPQVRANGWAPMTRHARFGQLRRWAPLCAVGGPNPDYRTAPLAGEHTDLLLTELGCSERAIAELRADNIVGSE